MIVMMLMTAAAMVVVLVVMVVMMVSAPASMLVVVLMLVIMAAAPVLMIVMMVMLVMLVVVIMAVAFDVLVQLVVEAGVVDGMEHPMPELVLVHVEDGAHECEADLLHGFELAVAFDTVLDIRQVQGDPVPVLVDDSGLDVPEEASGFLGNPLADGHEGLAHPGLGVRVPSGDRPLEALGASSRDLQRGVLVLLVVVIVAAAFAVRSVLVSAHLIIS